MKHNKVVEMFKSVESEILNSQNLYIKWLNEEIIMRLLIRHTNIYLNDNYNVDPIRNQEKARRDFLLALISSSDFVGSDEHRDKVIEELYCFMTNFIYNGRTRLENEEKK